MLKKYQLKEKRKERRKDRWGTPHKGRRNTVPLATQLFFLLDSLAGGAGGRRGRELCPTKTRATSLLLLFLLWNCGICCFTVSRWLASPKDGSHYNPGFRQYLSQLRVKAQRPRQPRPAADAGSLPQGKRFSVNFSWCCFFVSLCNFSSLAERVIPNVRSQIFSEVVFLSLLAIRFDYFPAGVPGFYWHPLTKEQKDILPQWPDICTSHFPRLSLSGVQHW